MNTALSFIRALERSSSQQQFADKVVQEKPPLHDGAHDLLGEAVRAGFGIIDPGWIEIKPYGTGAPGLSFLLAVYGWSAVSGRNAYLPTRLAEAKIILGDNDAEAIEPKAYMAEKIVFTKKPALESATVDDGRLILHSQSYRWIDFGFARNGSPPAPAANAIWRPLRT